MFNSNVLGIGQSFQELDIFPSQRSPIPSENKLYNVNGTLFFDGEEIGSGSGSLDVETIEIDTTTLGDYNFQTNLENSPEFARAANTSVAISESGFIAFTFDFGTENSNRVYFYKREGENWVEGGDFILDPWPDEDDGAVCVAEGDLLIVTLSTGRQGVDYMPIHVYRWDNEEGEFNLINNITEDTEQFNFAGIMSMSGGVIAMIRYLSGRDGKEVNMMAWRITNEETGELTFMQNAPWNNQDTTDIRVEASQYARISVFTVGGNQYITFSRYRNDDTLIIDTYNVDGVETNLIDTITINQSAPYTVSSLRRHNLYIDTTNAGLEFLILSLRNTDGGDDSRLRFYRFENEEWVFKNELHFSNVLLGTGSTITFTGFRGYGEKDVLTSAGSRFNILTADGVRFYRTIKSESEILFGKEGFKLIEPVNDRIYFMSTSPDGQFISVNDTIQGSGDSPANILRIFERGPDIVEAREFKYIKDNVQADVLRTQTTLELNRLVSRDLIDDSLYNINGDLLWQDFTVDVTASDERIKKDIVLSDFGEDYIKVKELNTYRYKYRDPTGRSKENESVHGFIAQDVAEVLPSAVYSTPGPIPDILATNIEAEGDILKANPADYNIFPGDNIVVVLPAKNTVTCTVISTTINIIKIDKEINSTVNIYEHFVSDKQLLKKDRLLALLFGAVKHLQDKVEALEDQ